MSVCLSHWKVCFRRLVTKGCCRLGTNRGGWIVGETTLHLNAQGALRGRRLQGSIQPSNELYLRMLECSFITKGKEFIICLKYYEANFVQNYLISKKPFVDIKIIVIFVQFFGKLVQSVLGGISYSSCVQRLVLPLISLTFTISLISWH